MTDEDIEISKKLIETAREARKNAYVPFSEFSVGAAILCEDGRIYKGCNIENVSFGATNCAERTALFSAVADGERKFKAIAIAAGDEAIYPCGICRQVLSEFAPDIKIICAKKEGFEVYTLKELLPHGFTEFESQEK